MQNTEGLQRLNAELEELKHKILAERGQQPELRRQYMVAKEAAKEEAAAAAAVQSGPGMRK